MTKKKTTKIPFSEDKKKEKKTTRRIIWTPEKLEQSFSEILRFISEEKMPASKAVRMPNQMGNTMFFDYLKGLPEEELTEKQKEERSERYVRACDMRADLIFDEMIEIADTPVNGEERKKLANGDTEVMTKEMLGHRRLQLDARKWALGKMRPEKYGEKLGVKHEGEINTAPEVDLSKLSTDELKIYRDLQRKLNGSK